MRLTKSPGSEVVMETHKRSVDSYCASLLFLLTALTVFWKMKLKLLFVLGTSKFTFIQVYFHTDIQHSRSEITVETMRKE